jgi:hypothetical protein
MSGITVDGIEVEPCDYAHLLLWVQRLDARVSKLEQAAQPDPDRRARLAADELRGYQHSGNDADEWGQGPAYCETCHQPMQHVRPGKWQCDNEACVGNWTYRGDSRTSLR